MDVIPMCSIFQELQIVHDTGYFSALPSLEEYWQQVTTLPSVYTRSLTHNTLPPGSHVRVGTVFHEFFLMKKCVIARHFE